VEAALPAECVELAEEAVAAVHVLHRAQLRLLGLREPGLLLAARAHELLGLAQAVLQAGHEAWNLRACVILRRARARKQPLHQLEHAVVRQCLHALCGGNTRRGARAESTTLRERFARALHASAIHECLVVCISGLRAMILETEYLRLFKSEIKMTEVCVKDLMGGRRFETYTSTGRPVRFCAICGPKVGKNENWTAQAAGLFRAMWSYLNKTNSVEYGEEEWVRSHLDTIHTPTGHRYWFLLEEVQGNLSVVAYVYFDFKKGLGMYIVHILCQSSGWNATSALTAIAVEKAAVNNIPLVFLNFTGLHLDKIYRRCGFVDPSAELAPVVNGFKDPVHNQLLVKILESKTTVAKATANGTCDVKTRATGPKYVVVGYTAPVTAEDSDALLSAAPTAASSPAFADLEGLGDMDSAHRKRRRESEPPEAAPKPPEAAPSQTPDAGMVQNAAKRVWGVIARLSALYAQGARGVLDSPC
jgi:hypothetical protein